MIDLEKIDDVFVLTMTAGENRWNTTFTRAFAAAVDEVEGSSGATALVTASADSKFFSNGLDLEWVAANDPEHAGGDRAVFGTEFMDLMGRLILLPVPTVCAINGHAFGAGFMLALTHDVRFMREDRGYVCANEVEIGLTIPDPEVALFRHKLPANTFHETVMLARRWSGPDAVTAGIVSQVSPLETLRDDAIARAASLAHFGANREVFGRQKQALYGKDSILNQPYGAGYVLRNAPDFSRH